MLVVANAAKHTAVEAADASGAARPVRPDHEGAIMPVTKSTAERYFITAPLSENSPYKAWAIISLSEAGEVQIYSDFGSWAYAWTSHGRKSLKHFLCEVHEDYLLRKLAGRPKEFNAEATAKKIRKLILERWRARKMTREDAAYACRELEDIKDEYGHSADLFISECSVMKSLSWLYQHASEGDLAVMEWDGGLLDFVRLLWLVFVEELKRELAPSARHPLEERALCHLIVRG
jgi:hypothetical protein